MAVATACSIAPDAPSSTRLVAARLTRRLDVIPETPRHPTSASGDVMAVEHQTPSNHKGGRSSRRFASAGGIRGFCFFASAS